MRSNSIGCVVLLQNSHVLVLPSSLDKSVMITLSPDFNMLIYTKFHRKRWENLDEAIKINKNLQLVLKKIIVSPPFCECRSKITVLKLNSSAAYLQVPQAKRIAASQLPVQTRRLKRNSKYVSAYLQPLHGGEVARHNYNPHPTDFIVLPPMTHRFIFV